jgi:hypothetical protein
MATIIYATIFAQTSDRKRLHYLKIIFTIGNKPFLNKQTSLFDILPSKRIMMKQTVECQDDSFCLSLLPIGPPALRRSDVNPSPNPLLAKQHYIPPLFSLPSFSLLSDLT